jgi:F-type H+-transporting ATPase subunit alpha
LSDEDRNAVIEIARQALTPFQPRPKPESKPASESRAKADPGGGSEPDAATERKPQARERS